MKALIILGSIALAMSRPAIAQYPGLEIYIEDPADISLDTFADTGEWQFFKMRSYCYATLKNERGRMLVGYDRRRNAGHLAFWSNDITGYRTSDTTNIEVDFAPILPGQGIGELDRSWGLVRGLVAVNSKQDTVFNMKAAGADMLGKIGKYDLIGFLTADGKVMQQFALLNSAAAMRRLRGCVPA